MSEKSPYSPEEAYSEAGQMKERLAKENPDQGGVYSHEQYDTTEAIIEEKNERAKTAAKNLFDGICSKYEEIGNLGLDFDSFYKTMREIEDDGGIDAKYSVSGKDYNEGRFFFQKFCRALPYGPNANPKPILYSLKDIESIKQFAERAQELGASVVIPEIIAESTEQTEVSDEAVNDWILDIVRKPGEMLQERADRLLCDEFACAEENSRDLRWLYRQVAEVVMRSNILSDLEGELSSNENYLSITETLSDEKLAEQIRARERILQEIGLKWSTSHYDRSTRMPSYEMQLAISQKISGRDKEDASFAAYNEQEVVYAGCLLSLTSSTRELISAIRVALESESDSLTGEYDRYGMVMKFSAGEHIFNKLWSEFFSKVLQGKKVFEIGGEKAAQGFQRMGATTAKPADAGHTGYFTFNYHAGERSNMIEVSNYRNYCAPHSADLVCSSRVFDIGSGIDTIAEPSSPGQDKEHLGEREMMLVLTNILKDKGFLIHYRSPIEKSEEGLGISHICQVKSEAHICRWHQDAVDAPHDSYVGKKHMVFDEETQTFERSE